MSELNINVKFYNEVERELFRQNYEPYFDRLNDLVSNGMSIPVETFRSYAILHHLNPGLDSTLTQSSIETKKDQLLGVFDTYTDFQIQNSRLLAPFGTNNEINNVSQELGNAGILSALDRAFGTQPADWTRLDRKDHKDFDFKSAVSADLKTAIVTEAKGSIQRNNQVLTPISGLKSSITTKKKDEQFKLNYPRGANLLIGGITVADPNNDLQLYLVDPASTTDLAENELIKIKLLKRLSFYTAWLSYISPRSDAVKLLRERISVLSALPNVSDIDGLQLTNYDGEDFFIKENFLRRNSHIDDRVLGRVIALDDKYGLFLGLKSDVLDIIVEQRHGSINSYKSKINTINRNIEASIPTSYLDKALFKSILSRSFSRFDSRSKRIRFVINKVELTTDSSGLVYGIFNQEQFN